jgi:hypothetical protein
MMMIPDWITKDMVTNAIEEAGKKDRPARLGDIRPATLPEGRCVQTLHAWSRRASSGPSSGNPCGRRSGSRNRLVRRLFTRILFSCIATHNCHLKRCAA